MHIYIYTYIHLYLGNKTTVLDESRPDLEVHRNQWHFTEYTASEDTLKILEGTE